MEPNYTNPTKPGNTPHTPVNFGQHKKAKLRYKPMAGAIYEGNLEPAGNIGTEAKDF
jgi:hypothetical protein